MLPFPPTTVKAFIPMEKGDSTMTVVCRGDANTIDKWDDKVVEVLPEMGSDSASSEVLETEKTEWERGAAAYTDVDMARTDA
mmetsp:Transcript_20983/g.37489  ORF Transcript_20983/g.37489 Transcript_20983/m.37489 type:complete len:82 (-) Transcript_20983:124-369(-)